MNSILDSEQLTNKRFYYNLRPVSTITVFGILLACVFILIRMYFVYKLKVLYAEMKVDTNIGQYNDYLYYNWFIIFTTIVFCILFFITLVAFCIWLYRAYFNLYSIGFAVLRTTPGWAVGWLFVPIAQLKYIDLVMIDLLFGTKSVFKKAFSSGNPDSAVNTIMVRCFSTLFCFMIMLYTKGVFLRFSPSINTGDRRFLFDLLGGFVGLLCGVVIILIILEVSKKQTKLYMNQ